MSLFLNFWVLRSSLFSLIHNYCEGQGTGALAQCELSLSWLFAINWMPVSNWNVYFYLFLYRFNRFLYITTSKDKFGEKCRELLTGNGSQSNCRRQQRMTFMAKILFSLIILMLSPVTKLVMFKRLPFTALSFFRVRSMWSLEIT